MKLQNSNVFIKIILMTAQMTNFISSKFSNFDQNLIKIRHSILMKNFDAFALGLNEQWKTSSKFIKNKIFWNEYNIFRWENKLAVLFWKKYSRLRGSNYYSKECQRQSPRIKCTRIMTSKCLKIASISLLNCYSILNMLSHDPSVCYYFDLRVT